MIGVDVNAGCGGHRKCFSVVVVVDGRVEARYDNVPLQRLIRLLWEHRPQILAVDNVLELGDSKDELVRIVSMMPGEMDIVQVTVTDSGEYIDLKKLAVEAGLLPRGHGKLSPSQTALLAALLAEKGYGARVRFLEEKTKIVVTKARRLNAGGMSSNRYKRRVRAAILRAVRDIKRALDKNRLDYDLVFRKSGGGLESAAFVVYASRSKLYGIVKQHEDNDVRIEIKPVYSPAIHFDVERRQSLYTEKPFLIVGVDPGMSTGLAALDLDGRLVFAFSKRGIDRQDVIEIIRSHGIPLVIATDVRPAPEFAKKLAAALGVPLYEPPEPLPVDEKREIAARYRLPGKPDPHVRDALAAAYYAYHSFQQKMRRVEAEIAKLDIDIDVYRVKADVIRGKTIAEALEKEIERILDTGEQGLVVKKFRRGEHREGERSRSAQEGVDKEHVERLRAELETLRAENIMLKKKIQELKMKLEEAEANYKSLMSELSEKVEADRLVSFLRHEVEVLRRELESLRVEVERMRAERRVLLEALVDVALGRSILLPYRRDIADIDEGAVELGRGIVYVERLDSVSSTDVDRLQRMRVRAIVANSVRDEVAEFIESRGGIAVVRAAPYDARVLGEVALFSAEVVFDTYARLEALRKKRGGGERRGISMEKLKSLLMEYRALRAREFFGEEASMSESSPL